MPLFYNFKFLFFDVEELIRLIAMATKIDMFFKMKHNLSYIVCIIPLLADYYISKRKHIL